MINTKVTLAGVELKNPVMTASGTFGSGAEYAEFVDLNKLGAVVTKGVANVPWPGNPTPRVAEVYGGMLNAVGLQNPGIDLFVERDIPFLKQFDTKIMVNVCGHSTEEYIEVVERLRDQPVDLLEINISCPNVKEGGIAFGQDPKAVEAITKEMKKHAAQPVIMKLSPNVTDISEIALAAESAGADAVSMINTLTGMRIDINTKRPIIHNNTGGFSGPALLPIAVRMVWQTYQKVKIPIVGLGGISSNGRLGALGLGLLSSTLALGGSLARGLLGGKAGTALGKGLLLCGRSRLDGILVCIGIVIDGGLLGLDRGRRGLAHRIDYLGLNNGRHLFLRLAELTDGTADRAAHLWELIRAKQQKAEDHDDRELTLSNTKHTYLQGSM